jgi:hypothetical protein
MFALPRLSHGQRPALATGPVWIGAVNLEPTGIQSPDCPARSEQLYQMHYPSPQYEQYM